MANSELTEDIKIEYRSDHQNDKHDINTLRENGQKISSIKSNTNSIPKDIYQRRIIREKIRTYVNENNLIPPASLAELTLHANKIIHTLGDEFNQFKDFIIVIINN